MTIDAVTPIDRPTIARSAEHLPEQPTRQPDPRRRYSWPADPRHANVIRDAVHRWLGTLPLSAHDAASMVVAVDAAVENVIRHAYIDQAPGCVEIACWTDHSEVCAEITDHGTWRAPRERVIGRGIPLMERLIESVSVESGDHGTRVLLRHPLGTRSGAVSGSTPPSAG
jgi:anti-sigma regulatory factor (Ser/Thr protein kinase)